MSPQEKYPGLGRSTDSPRVNEIQSAVDEVTRVSRRKLRTPGVGDRRDLGIELANRLASPPATGGDCSKSLGGISIERKHAISENALEH
jgi:hypothetical protein